MQETQETQFWFLGWGDPLEEEKATHSNILAWRIPMDRGAWWATVHGVVKSRTQWQDRAHTHTHTHTEYRLRQSWACIHWLSCLRCTINLFFLPPQQTRWCVKQAGQVWNQIDLFLFRFCWTWGRGLRVLSVKWEHWYPLGKTGVRISGNVHGDANLIDAQKENKWW